MSSRSPTPGFYLTVLAASLVNKEKFVLSGEYVHGSTSVAKFAVSLDEPSAGFFLLRFDVGSTV